MREYELIIAQLWGQDPTRSVGLEELKPRLIEVAERRYQAANSLWGRATTDWHARRNAGLKAYVRYEVEFRLRQMWPPRTTKYTRDQFKQFLLFDETENRNEDQEKQDLLSNPAAGVILNDLRLSDGALSFFREWGLRLGQRGSKPNFLIRCYAHGFDRCPVPFEFWTDESVANFMSAFLARDDAPDLLITAEQVRQWRRRELRLYPAKPAIVRGCNLPRTCASGPDFNLVYDTKAAKHHRLNITALLGSRT